MARSQKPGKSDSDSDGNYKSVVIYQRSTTDGSTRYEGQNVTKRTIYNSLDTWGIGSDETRYLWNADALDKYVRIDAVYVSVAESQK